MNTKWGRLKLDKTREEDQRHGCRKTSEQIESDTQGIKVKVYDEFGNLIKVKKS